ncbi:hypothetical protein ACVINW_001434 [Bradyrhizobium sp. USDA 4461]
MSDLGRKSSLPVEVSSVEMPSGEYPCDGATTVAPTPALNEINYADPIAVRDLIRQVHPFGELLRYEGIAEACYLGHGRELVGLSTPPVIPEPDEIALAEVINPSVEWIMSIENDERRAYVILATRFYGIDESHKEAILSVQDAGVVGLLAQANLRPPEKAKRRRAVRRSRSTLKVSGLKWHSHQKRVCTGNASAGDLFAAFKD